MAKLSAKLASPLTRQQKLKARTLYLYDGATPRDIAERLGVHPRQISNLANKQAWHRLRKPAEEKGQQMINVAADRYKAVAEEAMGNAVMRLPLIIDKGFRLAESADDGKEYGMAVGGACKAVTTLRTIAGLDTSAAPETRAAHLAVFFGRLPEADPKPEPINVTPPPVESVFEFA